MEEKEFFERYINYEISLSKFFKELGLKPNQNQLIRAFTLISKGETVFEASNSDLGGVFSKRKEGSRSDTNAKNALKGLMKWQEEHKMELVRVLEAGHKFINDDGVTIYVKTKYEFVGLNEFVKVIYSKSENLGTIIEEALVKLKAQYKPVEKKRKYHPLENFKRARKTVFTKIIRIFEYSKEAGLNPITECQRVLDKSWGIFNILKDEFEENQNRESFIKEFESQFNTDEINENTEVITEQERMM